MAINDYLQTGDYIPKNQSFLGDCRQGYLVIDQRGEYQPDRSDAIVLGVNITRTYDRYVVWNAERFTDGRSYYSYGTYESDVARAVEEFLRRDAANGGKRLKHNN